MKLAHILSSTFLAVSRSITPVIAAELPQSAELQFTGNLGIPATMNFKRSGDRYQIVSQIRLPLYRIQFESSGNIQDNSLKPIYYKDTRNGKIYAQAKFSDHQVIYGKINNSQEAKVNGPVMDLFTLAWQLAANNAQMPQGLKITNGKKIYPISQLKSIGSGQYILKGRTLNVSTYQVNCGHDTITYVFATELGYMPIKINYHDNGKTYNLQLTDVKINGKSL